VRIEYEDLTPEQFAAKVAAYQAKLAGMFEQSRELEAGITEALGGLRHD
jgi:type I restriction enzyme M protein